jgi:hypothetical protein
MIDRNFVLSPLISEFGDGLTRSFHLSC